MAETATRERSELQIAGSQPWREWVGRLATFARMPRSVLVDVALARYAESIGFDEKAPKR